VTRDFHRLRKPVLPALAAEAAWPFALLTLLFIGAAGWEWSRLNQAPGWRAWVLAAAPAPSLPKVSRIQAAR
jgi:hypothetical protein